MAKFPGDLAHTVAKQWGNLIAGDYIAPDLPPPKILKAIMEATYLAASVAEEGRFSQFNVLVTRNGVEMEDALEVFPFGQPRAVTVAELRRLAPASDLRKSAIWVGYDGDNAPVILGLVDLGTSWHRARLGFTYNYRVPRHLIIQADRPGHLKAYQGEYHVATLADGELFVGTLNNFHLFLHRTVNQGIQSLAENFSLPTYEHPRDFENFWFIAHWNVVAAIVNSISLSGHGGMLIMTQPGADHAKTCLRVKYSGSAGILRSSFIEFINARNRAADLYERSEQQKKKISKNVFEAEFRLMGAADKLAEAIRFVAQLAGCDGAIVLSSDLTLLGFGAEIRAEMDFDESVLEVVDEMRKKYKACDVEQFGMRHRSAIKLASQAEHCVVLAVSQDGPITAVWRGKVMSS